MFCRSLLTITLVASSAAAAAVATATAGPSGCAQFDANWNLLAFGFNGKDYNAGTQDKWTSTTGRKTVFGHLVLYVLTWNQFLATDITTSNRPWVSSFFFSVADGYLLNLYYKKTQAFRLSQRDLLPVSGMRFHFLFGMLNTLSNSFWGGSSQTPSTFSMWTLPTQLLSTFTMSPIRVGLCSRSP